MPLFAANVAVAASRRDRLFTALLCRRLTGREIVQLGCIAVARALARSHLAAVRLALPGGFAERTITAGRHILTHGELSGVRAVARPKRTAASLAACLLKKRSQRSLEVWLAVWLAEKSWL